MWLKCNTDPRKTSSIFALQEQMIETKAWIKIRGLVDDDSCRLCGEHRETPSVRMQETGRNGVSKAP